MSAMIVESSVPTSLTEIKKEIIAKHLGHLDVESLETFKKALCRMKPPIGAGPVKMKCIKDKSVKELVEFIFRCHMEKHAAQTVRNVLKAIADNQTRLSIDREIREATQRRKSLDTETHNAIQKRKSMDAETNEAMQHVTSIKTKRNEDIRVEKEDDHQVQSSASKIVVVSDDEDAPRPGPSEKKIKREADCDAEPGTSDNKEATARIYKAPAQSAPAPEHSLSKKAGAQPVISTENQIINIIATHLKSLEESNLQEFKELLCWIPPPIQNSNIQMSEIKNKSVEEMVGFIFRRYTTRRAPAAIKNILKVMKENQIVSRIDRDIRKRK